MSTLTERFHQHDKSRQVFSLASFCSVLYDHTFAATDQHLKELGLKKGFGSVSSPSDHKALIAQIEKLMGPRVHGSIGGSCCNVARTLAQLGEPVSFATNVGNDELSEHVQDSLSSTPLLTTRVSKADGTTGSTAVLVTEDGERTMNADLGVSAVLGKEAFCADDFLQSKVFHFCGYQWGVPSQKKVLLEALHLAREADILVSFDIADPSVVSLFASDFRQLIEDCHLAFCNEPEVLALLGEDFESIIHQHWPEKIFALKRGAKDVLICHEGLTKAVPTVKSVKVCDTTGAGDVFAAGFLKGLLCNAGLDGSAKIAAMLAADVISRYGVMVSHEATDSAARWLASLA